MSNNYIVKTINYWTGISDNNWNNSVNWSCGKVPGLNTEVIVQSGILRYPVINIDVNCKSLIVSPGAYITVSNCGSINLNGKILK